jgi:hypothetical protein
MAKPEFCPAYLLDEFVATHCAIICLTAVVCRTPSLPKAAGSAPVNAAGGAAGGDGRLGEREAEDILVIDSKLVYEVSVLVCGVKFGTVCVVSSSGPSSQWRARR